MRLPPFLLLAALASCTQTSSPHNSQKPVFDVPALVGKDINQIQAIMGAPVSDDEPATGEHYWEKAFVRDTLLLTVRYAADSRQVVAFYISTRHGQTADTTTLRTLANLTEQQPKLVVKAVPMALDPHLYTSVKAQIK